MGPQKTSTESRWRWAGVGLLLTTVFCVPGDARQAPPAAQGAPQQGGGQQPPAQQPPAQQPPIFQTGINVVRVDVIVSDNKTGAQIADLKESDFDIVEDGKPQKIEAFRFIKLDGGVSEAIKEAAMTRLRPVLMTSVATVAGHFPLTLVDGPGAAARRDGCGRAGAIGAGASPARRAAPRCPRAGGRPRRRGHAAGRG